jgi:hypothetical protein
MPFTFAHPAAVLPIHAAARGRLPLIALGVGSIMPDVGYFFAPVATFEWNNHEPLRSLTFCLPWGLVLLGLLWALQAGWQQLLPEPLRPRGPLLVWSPRALPGLACGLVLGALSHDLWDAWTHEDGWFVRHIPGLRREALPGLTWPRLFQYLSTLVGLAVLAYVLRARLRRLRPDWRLAFWAGALALSLAASLVTEVVLRGRAVPFYFATTAIRDMVLLTTAAALVLRGLRPLAVARQAGD